MAKSNLESTRVRKIGFAGLCFLIFGIIFRAVIFPPFLESHIKKKITLKKGSPMRETWSKSSTPYELHVYLFNVTNPDEISKGEKPIVTEVGPFIYDMWQEKLNQIDYEEDDTLSYTVKDTYFFNAEKSNGLSDNNELTLIHLFCIATPNGVLKSNPSRMTIASKAIDSVIENPESMFIKVKVKIFLFDGIRVGCKGKDDFFALAFCNDMKQFHVKYRMEKGDGYFASSIFGTLNNTDVYSGKIRIRRGTRNIIEVGDILEYNDMETMSIWKNDECDALIGTDGTMFHPFLNAKKKKNLQVTKTSYCRGFTYQYDSDVEFAGLKLLRYTTSLGSDMGTNPKDKCFCIAPDKCLRNGVYELYKCFNLARIGSNPHFYMADPYYGNAVEGLNPMKEKHMSTIDIDPLTGLAVRTHFRVQFSVELKKIKKYRLMQNFPEALLPMTWCDKVTILPDFLIHKIKNMYKIIAVANMLTYLMIFSGLTMWGYAIFWEFRLKKEKRTAIKKVGVENERQQN